MRLKSSESREIEVEHRDAAGVDGLDPPILVNEDEGYVGAHQLLVNFKQGYELAVLLHLFDNTAGMAPMLAAASGLNELELHENGEHITRLVLSKGEVFLILDMVRSSL